MVNDIFKTRSCSGCLSAAFNIYSNNFTKVFRATWVWALACSILCGITVFAHIPTWAAGGPMANLVFPALVLVLICIGMIVINTRMISGIVTMMNEAPLKSTFYKLLRINVFILATTIIASIIITSITVGIASIGFFKSASPLVNTLAIVGSAIILFVFQVIALLPFIHSGTRYIFYKDTKFKDIFGSVYHIGFRRLGFIFSLVFVTCLICFTLGLFLCIPACITNFASNIDSIGVAEGDISGLPSYFSWLNCLSNTIMAFVIQYIFIWIVLSFFYAFGSIEADKSTNK